MRMLSIRRNFAKWRYFKETEPDYELCEVDCSEIDHWRKIQEDAKHPTEFFEVEVFQGDRTELHKV